jgi:hypothetical protein
MPPFLERRVVPELIRLFAASQAMAMVAVHAAWLLLAIAVWGHAGDSEVMDAVGKRLLRAYAWLGGIGPDGRGDETRLMLVWAKLSFVVYGVEVLLRMVRGERRPIALWRLALGSGAVAFAGVLFALRPQGLDGEALAVASGFGLFALGATFWGVGARRLGDFIARRLEAGRPRRSSPAMEEDPLGAG